MVRIVVFMYFLTKITREWIPALLQLEGCDPRRGIIFLVKRKNPKEHAKK